MIIEAMAQTAGIVINSGQAGDNSNGIVFFAGIDKAKFRIPVIGRPTFVRDKPD